MNESYKAPIKNLYYGKRKKTNLTRYEVAKELGVNYDVYKAIEKGDTNMPKPLLEKFHEIVNKDKGEITINRERNQTNINLWFLEMCEKDEDTHKYKLYNVMDTYNISSLVDLGHLLGYTNGSYISFCLKKPNSTPYIFKERLYDFFHDVKNIQMSVKKNYRKVDNVYVDWYKSFDINTWLEEQYQLGKRKCEMEKEIGVFRGFLSRCMNRTYIPRNSIIAKLKNYVETSQKESIQEETNFDEMIQPEDEEPVNVSKIEDKMPELPKSDESNYLETKLYKKLNDARYDILKHKEYISLLRDEMAYHENIIKELETKVNALVEILYDKTEGE